MVGGWGVGPMTWIGSEDRDGLRTGSLEKVPPSRVQEARLKPNPWRPNAVDDGPWRWQCEGARMWVSQYLEKKVSAEREVEVGRRRGSLLKAENLTGSRCSVW